MERLIIAIKNWLLCLRFPFLYKKFDLWGNFNYTKPFVERYESTFLDDMPYGWRKALGINMAKDIKRVVKKYGIENFYEVHQVKEKYGTLRWYDNSSNPELQKIKNGYEQISSITCIRCGRPAKFYTTSWICPYCEDCIDIVKQKTNSPIREIK